MIDGDASGFFEMGGEEGADGSFVEDSRKERPCLTACST